MPHQAHNIPWSVLVSHLKPIIYEPRLELLPLQNTKLSVSNFYLTDKDDQTKALNYFVDAFAANIEAHTRDERKKYPSKVDAPADDDAIIDDATARLITPSVTSWCYDAAYISQHEKVARRKAAQLSAQRDPGASVEEDVPASHTRVASPCRHVDEGRCECAIPMSERKTAAFMRKYRQNDCYRFKDVNGEAFFPVELVKTLLLYDKMDPILGICARADVDLRRWKRMAKCYDSENDVGWDQVYVCALEVYICLNICQSFPGLWDPMSRTHHTGPQQDYRSTALYQRMLYRCTLEGRASDIPVAPHRYFLGIRRGQFQAFSKLKYPLDRSSMAALHGIVSIQDLLTADRRAPEYLAPSKAECASVRATLRKRGLPNELIANILQHAGYEPYGLLDVPNDPLHPDNSQVLAAHLKYCWRLIIRCNVMAQELDTQIHWKDEIIYILNDILSVTGDRKLIRHEDDESGQHPAFV